MTRGKAGRPHTWHKQRDVYGRLPRHSTGQTGQGYADILKSVYNAGVKGAKFLYDNREKIMEYGKEAYSGEVGTYLKNLIPDSDANARPGFAGEFHTVLELPNGKYGVGNFIGPGTNLTTRLKRGDPPRTAVDKVARAHDLRYATAANADEIRKADNIFISKVAELDRKKADSSKNLTQAKIMSAKVLAEDLGLLSKGSFSKFREGAPVRNVSDSDMGYLKGELSAMEQEGYGALPGEMLKLKLIKKMRKGSGKSGGGTGKLADLVSERILPELFDKLKVKNPLSKSQTKLLVDGAMTMANFADSNGGVDKVANQIYSISKSVMNLLTHPSNLKQSGGAKTRGLSAAKHNSLLLKLSHGMTKAVKQHMKGKTGSGMSGGEWYDDFYSGFKSVFKPGAMILGTVADALGQPEIGIPLQIISGLM